LLKRPWLLGRLTSTEYDLHLRVFPAYASGLMG